MEGSGKAKGSNEKPGGGKYDKSKLKATATIIKSTIHHNKKGKTLFFILVAEFSWHLLSTF